MSETEKQGAQAATTLNESGDKDLTSFVWEYILRIGQTWVSGLDFRLRLLVILIIWLVVNIVLLQIVWSKYGDRVADMYKKQESQTNTSEEKNSFKTTVEEEHLHRE